MAAKKTKTKKLSMIKSEATRKLHWPWSQLPPNLIQLPFSERHFHSTSSRGTTKSWLTPTRRCNATEQHQWCDQLYQLINDDSSNNSSTSYPHNRYIGNDSCISVLLSQMPINASYWCILKVDTTSEIHPSSTVLSSNRDNINPVAVNVKLGGNGSIPSSSVMVNYRIYSCYPYRGKYVWSYNYVWIRHECTTVDPFDAKKKYMEFTSIVQLEGKYYALSLQGTLVVMQDVDSHLVITGINKSRGVPSVSWRYFKEYLVELNGEILLVFLIHQKSVQVVDQVEVFRLGLCKLDWIKVERLQGKTLFLDECCIWANSVETCCRENCIYFTQSSNDNRWWVFDMESSCISPA